MQDVQATYVFTRVKRQLLLIEKLLILVLVLGIFSSVFWLIYWDLLKLDNVRSVFSHRHAKLWPSLVPFVLIIPIQFVVYLSYRSTRLVVDNDGVRSQQLPGTTFAGLKLFERAISWADLRNASYILSFQTLQLRSKKTTLPWAIRVKDWQLQDPSGMQSAAMSKDAEPDLIRILRQRGVFEAFPKNRQLEVVEFDLMKHVVTKRVLTGMAVIGAYSFIDVLLQKESWAFFNPAYCLPHIIAGLLVAGFLVWIMHRGNGDTPIPKGVIAAMAIFGGVACGTGSYVAGIRVNQLLGGPLLEAQYHRDAGCEALLPVDKTLPIVEYTSMTKSYWCSKDVDKTINVKVRKGWFGLYQFDLREHTQAIREYMQKH